jgi:hypothetical protein
VKKKYVMPEIAPEIAAPGLAELVAFTVELTKEANEAYEEGIALRKELAQLKKAKERAFRSPK